MNCSYSVWITTGKQTYAGDTFDIFIQLFGTEGDTGAIYLDLDDIQTFDQGFVDRFTLEIPHLGDLTRCCVGHDSRMKADWFVETVRVRDDLTREEWVFDFQQWVGKKQSEGEVLCRSVMEVNAER